MTTDIKAHFNSGTGMKAILNPRDAKACCVCRHWHRQDDVGGECRHPNMRWGVVYRNKQGIETLVEWFTTGRYATCKNWELGDDEDVNALLDALEMAVGALEWYTGSRSPETRLNDNGAGCTLDSIEERLTQKDK